MGKSRLVLLVSSVFLSFGVGAQVAATNTYKFLTLPTSARSAAMGGTFISSGVNDLNLVADNPSVLNSTLDQAATMTYINYFADVNIGYMAYAKHFEGIGTFSTGFQFMGYGDFIRADETGAQLGTFNAGDYALDISYGKPIDSLFSIGGSMKFIYSNYDDLNSFGLAFDLGATFVSKEKHFVAAAVINNIGVEVKPYFDGDRQSLPVQIQLSGSYKLPKAPLRFTVLANNLQRWDLTGAQPVDGLPAIGPTGGQNTIDEGKTFTVDNFFRHLVFGAEIIPSENFFIQFAYNYLRKQELAITGKTSLNALSMGVGFRMKRFKFSYAVASYAAKGTSHHLTLSTNFNSFSRK